MVVRQFKVGNSKSWQFKVGNFGKSKSNSNPDSNLNPNPNSTLNCQDTVGIDLLQVSQIFYNLNAIQ